MKRDPFRRLAMLTEQDLGRIHEASLEVLENTGFHVSNRRLRELLRGWGARVRDGETAVKIPHTLVEKALHSAPSHVRLCGTDARNDILVGGREIHIGSGGRPNLVVDPQTGERRGSTLRDVCLLTRLVDRLEHIRFCVIPTEATDIPGDYLDVNNFFHALHNTGKHIMDGVRSPQSLQHVLRLAERVAGGKRPLLERPVVSVITNVISPLKIDDQVAEIVMDLAEYGLPFTCSTAPIAGVTSPATLEGSLAQQNAESLFGVIVSQMINPGTPYLYGASLCTMDFRSMNFLFGSIETGIMNACAAQMANYYQLPIYASAGPSDAKTGDYQAGMEKALNILMAALAGGHYLHLAAGLLDGGLTASYGQLVLDNDLIGAVYRTLRGLQPSDERLAVDVIHEVGPGADYLTSEHTIEHMKEEYYIPSVMTRENEQAWSAAGRRSAWERAQSAAIERIQAPAACMDPAMTRLLLREFEHVVIPCP